MLKHITSMQVHCLLSSFRMASVTVFMCVCFAIVSNNAETVKKLKSIFDDFRVAAKMYAQVLTCEGVMGTIECSCILLVYTCIHTYIHAYIHTYVHTYIHTYIHTYTHIHTHTYTHTYNIHTYTYIRTYIHTFTHTHTH